LNQISELPLEASVAAQWFQPGQHMAISADAGWWQGADRQVSLDTEFLAHWKPVETVKWS
jgi:hypothetical protein